MRHIRMLQYVPGTLDGAFTRQGCDLVVADHVAAEYVERELAEYVDGPEDDAPPALETAMIEPSETTAMTERKRGRPRVRG